MKAVSVLTGDPTLPYGYNASGRFEDHDLQAIEQLREALAEVSGYHFSYWQDHHRLIERCLADRPQLVLNLCNTGYLNLPKRQLHVTALLEMLDVPFAGAGPESLALCHDKALATAAAADLGIPVPDTQLIRLSDQPQSLSGPYPRIIKLNDESGSTGITDQSVVANSQDAELQMARLHQQFPGRWALAQTFLTGMEVTVGVIGNPDTGFLTLSPIEVNYDGLENPGPRLLTIDSKTESDSEEWNAIRLRPAPLSESTCTLLVEQSRQLFARLGCRDYARFDFRSDETSTFRLIDANAHPVLEPGGMLAAMARHASLSYSDLLAEIIRAAERRIALSTG